MAASSPRASTPVPVGAISRAQPVTAVTVEISQVRVRRSPHTSRAIRPVATGAVPRATTVRAVE
ncbi:hypothetical protein OHQ89_01245 [Streptomyces canus]|uniref:hypothetical protein n=1 Tax=Streptomyces canus TaxID=58343 RepID=UPI0030E4F6A5